VPGVDKIECICSWPRSSANFFSVVFPFGENNATRDASICISIICGNLYVMWVLSPADCNPMQVRVHLRLLTRDLSSFSYIHRLSLSLFIFLFFHLIFYCAAGAWLPQFCHRSTFIRRIFKRRRMMFFSRIRQIDITYNHIYIFEWVLYIRAVIGNYFTRKILHRGFSYWHKKNYFFISPIKITETVFFIFLLTVFQYYFYYIVPLHIFYITL